MTKTGEIVVGLDIGTTKTAVVIGEIKDDQRIEIIGYGIKPSDGLRKGMVINIDRTVDSIVNAITEAESRANCEISNVFTGISGSHIKGINSHGLIAVKGNEVTQNDIHNVLEAAKAIAIPNDREIIHTLPREYSIDDQDGIRNPLGMAGVRLQSKVHIITGAKSSILNIIKCCNKAGLQVSNIILQQIASAEAILSDEEKDLGAVVVDIGGGTTDISVYHAGNIVHTAVLPIGGNHITNDITVGLRITAKQAEEIKQKYGSALGKSNGTEENISIGPIGSKANKTIPHSMLYCIISPRIEEVFELVKKEILSTGLYNLLGTGVVLTGGTSLLKDISTAAEDILDMPVRIGTPHSIAPGEDVFKSPSLSTSAGLVLFASKSKFGYSRATDKNIFRRIFGTTKNWLGQVF